MTDRKLGLKQKYEVKRIDGKKIPFGCIVMQWDDPNGRAGIAAFSQSVRNNGYKSLADDLDKRLKAFDVITEDLEQ